MDGRCKACGEADFLGRNGAEAHAGGEQGLVKAQTAVFFDDGHDVIEAVGKETEFILSRRQLVGLSWQDRAHAAAVFADFPQGVDDLPVLHKDDIAVFAHEL